jgi:hypothetical protein
MLSLLALLARPALRATRFWVSSENPASRHMTTTTQARPARTIHRWTQRT